MSVCNHRQEQTQAARGMMMTAGQASLSRFIFCDEDFATDARNRADRVSTPRTNVRTSHTSRACRAREVASIKSASIKRFTAAEPHCFLVLGNLLLGYFPHAARALPSLRLHWSFNQLAFPRVRRAVEGRDALPQRNCCRFSRHSPFPGMSQRTANLTKSTPTHASPASNAIV